MLLIMGVYKLPMPKYNHYQKMFLQNQQNNPETLEQSQYLTREDKTVTLNTIANCKYITQSGLKHSVTKHTASPVMKKDN